MRRRRVWLLPLLGAVGCSSFGTATDGPTGMDPTIDGSTDLDATAQGDGDASAADADAEPRECLDRGESAFEVCDSHAFCDDFDDTNDVGAKWQEVDADRGGSASIGGGRNGTGFISQLSDEDDSRARLFTSEKPLASQQVHVDFDLKTARPQIERADGFVDVLGFLSKRDVEMEATGLEWGPGGFRAFIGGTQLQGITFPRTCEWVHVHVAVTLRGDATGRLEVWINGKSELKVANVKTAKETTDTTFVALGGWSRYVTGTNTIGYDNVSVYVDD